MLGHDADHSDLSYPPVLRTSSKTQPLGPSSLRVLWGFPFCWPGAGASVQPRDAAAAILGIPSCLIAFFGTLFRKIILLHAILAACQQHFATVRAPVNDPPEQMRRFSHEASLAAPGQLAARSRLLHGRRYNTSVHVNSLSF